MRIIPAIVIAVTLIYGALVFIASRRRRPLPFPQPDGLFVVFVVPCLNEERVIGTTVEHLCELGGAQYAVLVVDDGSDDATSSVVESQLSDHVWLLRRELPDAQKGKGAALNAAFQYLTTSGVLRGRSADDVVVCVMDADGSCDRNILSEVGHLFADPAVGAAQVGVRMYNAEHNVLSRMQDMEFVAFTEIFQRARTRVGGSGLGGNGQFVRLSALASLGQAPWTDFLTEDLDLGIRLQCTGWRTLFVPTAAVHQQAVTSLARLVKQRTRWFQGHLQCWRRIPMILRCRRLRFTQAVDLSYHLITSVVMLAMGCFTGLAFVTLGFLSFVDPAEVWHLLGGHRWWYPVGYYLLAFGLCWLYAYVYWLKTPKLAFWRCVVYAHLYVAYSWVWIVAGLRAVVRTLLRRTSWVKTKRTTEVRKLSSIHEEPLAA